MTKTARAVLMPGASTEPAGGDETDEQAAPAPAAGDAPTTADLLARLAALDAENAALKTQLASKEVKLPFGVFEPETPHGKAAKEASAFAHLTVAEVMAKIDAGEAKEPTTGILCADGYYTRRG